MPGSTEARGVYGALDPESIDKSINDLQAGFWRQSILTWIGMPIFAGLTSFVPFLEPSCQEGFRNITIIFVVLYEIHHVYTEVTSWAATKAMLAPPEVTVLRHIGVLRRRRFFLLLGIIETIDLYTDLTFPFVARSCGVQLTEIWMKTWVKVPLVGRTVRNIVEVLRFWGCCLAFALFNVLITGFWGLLRVYTNTKTRPQLTEGTRISGEAFFGWAESAETAMLPSVAMLHEEIASERKYQYNPDGDTSKTMEARDREAHGKALRGESVSTEMFSEQEEKRVASAARLHNMILLCIKVFVGNMLQLWMQTSFYGITFDVLGQQGKIKLYMSIIFSVAAGLVRVVLVGPKLGCLGCFLGIINLYVCGWAIAKMVFAHICSSHMWNITTGCVDIANTMA